MGFVFLMMLMVFVLYNDIARHMAPGLSFKQGPRRNFGVRCGIF